MIRLFEDITDERHPAQRPKQEQQDKAHDPGKDVGISSSPGPAVGYTAVRTRSQNGGASSKERHVCLMGITKISLLVHHQRLLLLRGSSNMGNSGGLGVLLTLVAGSTHDCGFNRFCHRQLSLLHVGRRGVGTNILGSWIHSTGVFLVVTRI